MSEISETEDSVEEVDRKVELFIVETNFQALDAGFEEVHLNG
jgi:Pyruvate/2-oxoacid:ferredoxin oxidoreductase gamma subunit